MNTEQHPPLRIIGRQLNGQLVDVSVREGSNYFQFTDYFGKKLIDLIVVSRKNEPLEAGVFLNSDDPIQEWPLAEVLEFIEVRGPPNRGGGAGTPAALLSLIYLIGALEERDAHGNR